jgi:hypothetical protein
MRIRDSLLFSTRNTLARPCFPPPAGIFADLRAGPATRGLRDRGIAIAGCVGSAGQSAGQARVRRVVIGEPRRFR